MWWAPGNKGLEEWGFALLSWWNMKWLGKTAWCLGHKLVLGHHRQVTWAQVLWRERMQAEIKGTCPRKGRPRKYKKYSFHYKGQKCLTGWGRSLTSLLYKISCDSKHSGLQGMGCYFCSSSVSFWSTKKVPHSRRQGWCWPEMDLEAADVKVESSLGRKTQEYNERDCKEKFEEEEL